MEEAHPGSDGVNTPFRRIARLFRPDYGTMLVKHLIPNKPCIVTGIANDWGACKRWVDANGDVDLDQLCADVGNVRVPVDAIEVGAEMGYGHSRRSTMELRDFVATWRGARDDGSGGSTLWYLRDWHFARDCPDAARPAYVTPECFGTDLLNDWWRTEEIPKEILHARVIHIFKKHKFPIKYNN